MSPAPARQKYQKNGQSSVCSVKMLIEHIFSLMNRLKKADRSSLSQVTLSNIMIWDTIAKELSYDKMSVQEIFKEFRAMAGVRGRTAHNPTPPPKLQSTHGKLWEPSLAKMVFVVACCALLN